MADGKVLLKQFLHRRRAAAGFFEKRFFCTGGTHIGTGSAVSGGNLGGNCPSAPVLAPEVRYRVAIWVAIAFGTHIGTRSGGSGGNLGGKNFLGAI